MEPSLPCSDAGYWGPLLRGWAQRRAPGGRTFAHGFRPGSAQRSDVGHLSHGLTTCGRVQRGRVQRFLGSSWRQQPWRSDPQLQKLALGMPWNVSSLMRKEPETVCKVKKFWLDMVGLTLMHGKGSRTSLLERLWTLFHSEVSDSERWRAELMILGVLRGGTEKCSFWGFPRHTGWLRMLMLAATVRPGGEWLGRMAPLIWTRAVFCCWLLYSSWIVHTKYHFEA